MGNDTGLLLAVSFHSYFAWLDPLDGRHAAFMTSEHIMLLKADQFCAEVGNVLRLRDGELENLFDSFYIFKRP